MQTSPVKIVVSSQDFRTISGHPGHARRWLVFETDETGAPVLREQLELPPPLIFHRFKGPGPHPLDGAAILITRFSGEGFLSKMRKRGTEVLQTRERDARKAVADYIAGTLAPPPSRRLMSLVCKVRDAFSEHL